MSLLLDPLLCELLGLKANPVEGRAGRLVNMGTLNQFHWHLASFYLIMVMKYLQDTSKWMFLALVLK
jgi:hypothetical protein